MTLSQACRRLKAAAIDDRERLLEQAVRPGLTEALVAEAQAAMESTPQEGPEWASLAVAVAERGGDHALAATAWLTLAQALRVAGRHADALPAFDAAAQAALAGGEPGRAVQVQLGRIDSLDLLGRTDEALAHAAALEKALLQHGLAAEAAKARVNAGNIHFRRDRYADALACYEQALPALEGGDPIAVASLQANRANILTFLGRADEALALYAQARAAFAERGAAPAVAMIEANEAYLEAAAGRYVRALSALTRARATFAALGQALETAKCDAEIADVYRALNLWPEADACYARAVPALEDIPLAYEAARAEMGRAAVWARQGRGGDAQTALDHAEAVFRRQKNGVQGAHVRLLRATLARAEGRAEDAAAQAKAIARSFSRCGLPGWAAEARFLSAAASAPHTRLAALHGVRRAALRHGRAWLACRADQALGREYERRGSRARALRHLRAAASALDDLRDRISAEELHVAFLDDKLSVYEDLVTALLTRGTRRDIAEAFETLERAKARLLLERVQTAWDREIFKAESAAVPARLGALRAALARAYHRLQGFEPSESSRLLAEADGLPALEGAYREALREHEMAEAPGVLRRGGITPADVLREALPDDETLVEFFVAGGRIGAFVLTARGLRACPGLAGVEEGAHAARRLRFHLQRAESGGGRQAALTSQMGSSLQGVLRHLHGLLLEPLRPHLRTEKLVIVPHGLLHGLPFHAFYDGARYALDDHEFAFAPSAALWHAGARRAAAPAAPGGPTLLMGVPVPGLTHVADEIRALQQAMPGAEAYCGDEATRAVFQGRAEGARLIHLATHALFRVDNPLFSGLRFADDWLLARDLYGMTLRAELVTLAACRTGAAHIAPGDEPFGLVRGVLGAGARSLAVSLWPADDAATARLMSLFYGGLAAGAGRAAALRHAQRTLRAEEPNPYHWAPFVLVGER